MFTPPSILMSKLMDFWANYSQIRMLIAKFLYVRLYIANAFVVLGEELLINMLI
jgi:hypothetical protein